MDQHHPDYVDITEIQLNHYDCLEGLKPLGCSDVYGIDMYDV